MWPPRPQSRPVTSALLSRDGDSRGDVAGGKTWPGARRRPGSRTVSAVLAAPANMDACPACHTGTPAAAPTAAEDVMTITSPPQSQGRGTPPEGLCPALPGPSWPERGARTCAGGRKGHVCVQKGHACAPPRAPSPRSYPRPRAQPGVAFACPGPLPICDPRPLLLRHGGVVGRLRRGRAPLGSNRSFASFWR